MQDKVNKTFVGKVNGHSIYWSHREAKKDSYRFIILKNGIQIYDTVDLYGAIDHCLEESEWSTVQRKRFRELAIVHDPSNLKDFIKS